MTCLHLDFETRSNVDLKKCGIMRYVTDASTRVLMLAWAVDDEHPQLWFPEKGEMPSRLRKLLSNPKITKKAHNATFERLVFHHVLNIVTKACEWFCTAVKARMLSLPGDLDQLGKVLKMDVDKVKDKEGKRLINLFCKPRKPTKNNPNVWNTKKTHPQDWKRFCDYCIQDVITEREAERLMEPFKTHDVDWEMYVLDQDINDRGVPVDIELCESAIALSKIISAEYREKMDRLTHLDNSNSSKQLIPWLQERGYPFDNIKKDRVQLALRDFLDQMTSKCVKVLKLRLESARTSVKKYRAILNRHVGGWIHHVFLFAGAERTNRWGGRGFQPQNLPRSSKTFTKHMHVARDMIRARDLEGLRLIFGDVLDVLSSAIRTVVVAPKGKEVVVADLSSIEYVGAGWLAECERMLDVVRNGRDPYKSFAQDGFGIPYDKVTDEERQMAKPPVLAAPYGLGAGAEVGEYPDVRKTGLWGYAEGMGVKMTQEQSQKAHKAYHKAYPEVRETWWELEKAVKTAIRTGRKTKAGPLEFDVQKPFLRMKLPSGRYVYYLRPTLRKVRKKFNGEVKIREQISYEGRDQKTRKWVRIETYYGKLFENAVQAWARDILVIAMLRASKLGFEIIMHVHDEIVALVKKGLGKKMVDLLERIMAKANRWLGDVPLGAKGFYADFYQKR